MVRLHLVCVPTQTLPLHFRQFHLFENVAIQLLVGLPLEMVHSWRVLIIYSSGILGGALFQSVIYPFEDLAGGSPGVYSILTAHIATVIMVSVAPLTCRGVT